MKNFSDLIKQKREDKGWTQKELGQKIYVSDKTISRWETGKAYPDITLLLELASVLEIDYQELIEGNKYIERIKKEKRHQKRLIIILVTCISVFWIGLNYYISTPKEVKEEGIDFVLSCKWNYVETVTTKEEREKEFAQRGSYNVGSTSLVREKFRKEKYIEYLDIKNWEALDYAPTTVDTKVNEFTVKVDDERYKPKYVYFIICYDHDNYYIYYDRDDLWYYCKKDISHSYLFIKDLLAGKV